jgi:disulfide bond formation protein DsbB
VTRAPVSTSALFVGIGAAALAAVAAALVSQHVYDMQPCPWCVLQRAVFCALALAALALAGVRSALLVLLRAVLVTGLAAAGAAAALWQHFVAKSSSSCNLTLADRIVSGLGLDGWLPDVFAPRASCADAAVDLLGVPYEVWSLAAFVLLGAAAVWATWRGRPAQAHAG